jgi:putative membrane protein
MKFVMWVVINALGVGAAVLLFDDISLEGATSTGDQIVSLLAIGLVFGLVNACVRPIVNLLSLPLIMLTLGLFFIVINALMLLLTSKIADWLNLHFHVEGFWTAVGGGIVISIATMIAAFVLPSGE